MSVINKKPYIVSVLETLSDTESATLKNLIDGIGDEPIFRTLRVNNARTLSVADKGIKEITLEIPNAGVQTLYKGYLIYNDEVCVLVSYTADKNQLLTIVKMDEENNYSYVIMPCELSITELRSELDDAMSPNKVEVEAALANKANLVNGKVPESELPSYIDDVIEGYYYDEKFYEDAEHTQEIEGEAGKIYVDLETNYSYRWSGSAFVQIGGGDISVNVQVPVGETTQELKNLYVGDTIYDNKSYHTFNSGWVTNSTTEAFCTSIVNDTSATAGMVYLGKLYCSDLPESMVQAECVVEVIAEDANGKAIDITITSVDTAPYHWEYHRAKVDGSYVASGWQGMGGAKVVEVQLTAQNETDLLTNGSVTVALSAADGADLIGSELNMIKLEGADLGDVYLYKQNGVDDTNFYFGSLSSMFEGAVIFDGTDYSLYLATNQPLEVVGNPTIPAGATVNPLNALKIGSDYFNNDKPIHFIKLTSTTLTEALRSEILSDEYFVIIEYSNRYYYERQRRTSSPIGKYFDTLPTYTLSTTNNDYNVSKYYLEIREDNLTASGGSNDFYIPKNKVKSLNINSETATAGKVLTADGSGGTSWEDTVSATFVDWS